MRNAKHFHEQKKTREGRFYSLQSEAKRKKKPKKVRSPYYSRDDPQKNLFYSASALSNDLFFGANAPSLDKLNPPQTFLSIKKGKKWPLMVCGGRLLAFFGVFHGREFLAFFGGSGKSFENSGGHK